MRVRWIIAALLFTGGMINYMDRAVLSVTAPLISQAFGFSAEQLGWVFSSFFVGYVAFSFIGGQAADRFGAKWVLTISMVAWSIFCGLTALATGLWSLILLRILFGLGEGPFNSTLNKTVNNWFPAKERATAIGIAAAGQPLGGALAGPIAGYFATKHGWGAPFLVVALIGLVWTLAWVFLVTESPAKHRWVGAAEREELAGAASRAGQAEGPLMPLGYYLRQPAVLATAFAFFGFSYVIFFFLTWFPTYLMQTQGFSLKDMSLANVIPWLVGFLGLIIGGFVSDALYRTTGRPLLARKIVIAGGLGVAAVCVALAGSVSGPVAAISLMTCAVLGVYFTGNAYWAILQDIIPSRRMGGVGGFVSMLATTSGIIGPAVTGYLVQASGGFASAFILAGAVALGAAFAVAWFVKPFADEGANAALQAG